MREVRVYRLGQVPYGDALTLQTRLQRARIRQRIPDTLLLLEHPKVVTLGRSSKAEHVLLSRAALADRGYEVFETGRGGDVTFHGPGQLVGYPILDLSPDRQDVRRYVNDLEQIMIRLCARYALTATCQAKMNGAWIGNDKVGAIGVRISRWVTMHGFAINVSTDLADFGVIVPCGLHGRGVTSLSREVGREVTMEDAMDATEAEFAARFEATLYHPEGQPLDGLEPSAWAEDPWRDAPRAP